MMALAYETPRQRVCIGECTSLPPEAVDAEGGGTDQRVHACKGEWVMAMGEVSQIIPLLRRIKGGRGGIEFRHGDHKTRQMALTWCGASVLWHNFCGGINVRQETSGSFPAGRDRVNRRTITESIMGHTKSAVKRARQYQSNQLRNSAAKSLVKTKTRKLVGTVAAKDEAAIKAAYSEFCSALDKAAKKGSITKQTAIRRKSRAGARMRAALKA